jgi:hypothetical protein
MRRVRVPPFRFAIVEDGVYRGAYPTLKNFPYLKTLKLKTIISLIPEPPTLDLDDFCAMNGIDLIHYMGKSGPVANSPSNSLLTLAFFGSGEAEGRRSDECEGHRGGGSDNHQAIEAPCLYTLLGWHRCDRPRHLLPSTAAIMAQRSYGK